MRASGEGGRRGEIGAWWLECGRRKLLGCSADEEECGVECAGGGQHMLFLPAHGWARGVWRGTRYGHARSR